MTLKTELEKFAICKTHSGCWLVVRVNKDKDFRRRDSIQCQTFSVSNKGMFSRANISSNIIGHRIAEIFWPLKTLVVGPKQRGWQAAVWASKKCSKNGFCWPWGHLDPSVWPRPTLLAIQWGPAGAGAGANYCSGAPYKDCNQTQHVCKCLLVRHQNFYEDE